MILVKLYSVDRGTTVAINPADIALVVPLKPDQVANEHVKIIDAPACVRVYLRDAPDVIVWVGEHEPDRPLVDLLDLFDEMLWQALEDAKSRSGS